jgi:hypothetical protein
VLSDNIILLIGAKPELCCLTTYCYIREISLKKVHLFGHPFGVIFDSFLDPFLGRQFPTPEMSFYNGDLAPKIDPKNCSKTARNRDPENAIQAVICVPENGVCPVRGSQKGLKNDPKKEHFLDINDADLADVRIRSE